MTPRKLRILGAEDEAPIRTGLTDVLVFHGYEAESAADGQAGLARALGGRFDLLLLDVMLPGADGFTIRERVARRPASSRSPCSPPGAPTRT
jgi:two-component system response regulator RegX3